MTDLLLDPPWSMPTHAVRAPLARWLAAEARRAYDDFGAFRLLDVGCGRKPYAPLFAPYVREHVGIDAQENPAAELHGPVEALPLDDGTFEVVLCAQLLEHCDDPARAVRELHRATVPGGRVLLSTHGTMVYHPNPDDLWRWTHAGLERLFLVNGDWSAVTVTPASGTTACVGMLVSIYLDVALGRTPFNRARESFVAAVNRVSAALDARSSSLREPRAGSIFANYHVVAEKASARGQIVTRPVTDAASQPR